MGKRANLMAVKAGLSYGVSEAAKALGNNEATICNWIKDGLPVMASMKPCLILRAELCDYLRTKYQNSKTKLSLDELYCLPCQAGGKLVDMAVEAIPKNSKTTRPKGGCGRCEAMATCVSNWHEADTTGTRFVLTDDPPKENAANLAGFNGVTTSIETVQVPTKNSPEWAGAPAIILRHFCGVAA
jgi:hypothetical protein